MAQSLLRGLGHHAGVDALRVVVLEAGQSLRSRSTREAVPEAAHRRHHPELRPEAARLDVQAAGREEGRNRLTQRRCCR